MKANELYLKQKIIQYYSTLESRLGYVNWLKETKHFGFYPNGKEEISIREAQRIMEDKLAEALDLRTDSIILDAGCGMGNAAIYLAKKYKWRIEGIDILDWNIKKAKNKIESSGLKTQINFKVMDYSSTNFPNNFFDGVYTMETLVHAIDYKKTLKEFYRLLKPGGKLVLFEYSIKPDNMVEKEHKKSRDMILKEMGAYSLFHFLHGGFPKLLYKAGFINIRVEDYTERIIPMLKNFYKFAYWPYQIIKRLKLKKQFINITCAVETYDPIIQNDVWRYNLITAIKPN